jgi:hypothetical protein
MGQVTSKEDHLFGYRTSTLCLKKEIRFKDIKIQQEVMDLSKQNIFTITSDISYLTMIKRLDL